MGYIAKQIRKGGNQRFAEAVVIPTTRSQEEVKVVIEHVCGNLNENFQKWRSESSVMRRWWSEKTGPVGQFLYSVEPASADRIRIGFGKRPSEFPALRSKQVGSTNGYWLAEASIKGPRSEVELSLLIWITGDDGKIKQKDRYEQLVTELRAGL